MLATIISLHTCSVTIELLWRNCSEWNFLSVQHLKVQFSFRIWTWTWMDKWDPRISCLDYLQRKTVSANPGSGLGHFGHVHSWACKKPAWQIAAIESAGDSICLASPLPMSNINSMHLEKPTKDGEKGRKYLRLGPHLSPLGIHVTDRSNWWLKAKKVSIIIALCHKLIINKNRMSHAKGVWQLKELSGFF